MTQIHNLLTISEFNKDRVRYLHNKSKTDVKKDVQILLEWANNQGHLPKPHDVNRLERFLVKNNFEVEQTKIALDKYYTYKGFCPDFFIYLDSTSLTMQNVKKSMICAPMPKLLPTMERLIIFKYVSGQEDIYSFKDFACFVFMIAELQFSYDYNTTNRYLFDTSSMTLKHIEKVDVSVLKKAAALYQEALSGITRLEFVNLPQEFHVFMNSLEKSLPEEAFKQVKRYKTVDCLYKCIPKEYLPKELGGDQPSIYDIYNNWEIEMIYQKEFFEDHIKRISNEKLRVGEFPYNVIFNTDGSFKTTLMQN